MFITRPVPSRPRPRPARRAPGPLSALPRRPPGPSQLFMFQWMKINELPLSRKATSVASTWLRTRPSDAAKQQIGTLRDQSDHGAGKMDASTGDLTIVGLSTSTRTDEDGAPAASASASTPGTADLDSDSDDEASDPSLTRRETIQVYVARCGLGRG